MYVRPRPASLFFPPSLPLNILLPLSHTHIPSHPPPSLLSPPPKNQTPLYDIAHTAATAPAAANATMDAVERLAPLVACPGIG